MSFRWPRAGGWEGRSCQSVLRCGTRAAFPGGLVIVAKELPPPPHPRAWKTAPLRRPQIGLLRAKL